MERSEIPNDLVGAWQEGVAILNEVCAVMRARGHDIGELSYAVCHVDEKHNYVARALSVPPMERLSRLYRILDFNARNRQYSRGQHDIWVICPRAHAECHGFYILEIPGPPMAPELFRQLDRFYAGDDLVHACAPGQ